MKKFEVKIELPENVAQAIGLENGNKTIQMDAANTFQAKMLLVNALKKKKLPFDFLEVNGNYIVVCHVNGKKYNMSKFITFKILESVEQ